LGVDNNSILVKYTFSGDANLDGSVGVGDLGVVATNYGATSGAIWGQGDFNYDGAVNVADLGALASYYGDSLAGGSATAAIAVPTSIVAPASITGTSSVPEPSGLTILAITAVGLLNRRRRCRNARQPIHISSSRGHAYVHA